MGAGVWLYRQTETPAEAPPHGLFTVGYYAPDGTWTAESDHGTADEAAARVHYLNGGADAEALISGAGSCRP